MSQYRLIYFNSFGKGEFIRLIFAAAGQEYEEKTIPEFVAGDFGDVVEKNDMRFTEEWLQYKPTTPFGIVPLLEVDGHIIGQNKAIAAFLAKRFGLCGKDEFDEAKAAMITETTEDAFLNPIVKYFPEPDKDKKASYGKEYATKIFPTFMKNFEKQVGETGYFIGDKLSYADIAFYTHFSLWTPYLEVKPQWNDYPKLKTVIENVEKNPGIAKWLKERPKYRF